MIKEFIKRDGRIVPFQASKALGWGEWGARGFKKYIDWQSIVVTTVAQMPERCHAKDFNDGLIQNALNEDTWAGQLMAGRIYAAQIHKEVFGGKKRRPLKEVHTAMIDAGVMVRLDYTDEEYDEIEKWVDHERDFHCAHYQLKQGRDKYAMRNRITGKVYETRQHALARVAMVMCEPHEKTTRMARLKSIYEDLYSERLSAPTPNHNNFGTGHNGFFSCCLFTCDDSKESIAASSHIAEVMTYMSAGLGENMMVRSLGDPIRSGSIVHSGKIPYYAKQTGIVKSNKQGSRGGSLNEFFSAYDPEVAEIMVLKNPRTPINKRNRSIDYTMMLNSWLLAKSAADEKIFLFNCYTAPDLYRALYGKDLDQFIELYQKYEQDSSFKKKWVSARQLVVNARSEGFETGRFYMILIDEVNYHTPHRDPILSSNLCVAPETLLLTDKGHQVISTLAGQKVNVWNGNEWSEVDVVKTGENQSLVTVSLSDGRRLECTPYHKFYVQRGFTKGGQVEEVRAHELREGDRLIKADLPVIEGNETLENAYLNGFYTGDGTRIREGVGRIYLYGEKANLAPILDSTRTWRVGATGRLELEFKGLREKFFVPDAQYSVASRLEWLAGIIDSDGCVYRNGTNESFTLSSCVWRFLRDVQDMLQELGINAKLTSMYPAGERFMPMNNGTGDYGLFDCKATYRLLISSSASQKLLDLGLKTHRLSMEKRTVQRSAEQFAVVVDVADHGRVDDTYCVTEPKRHMAVFNGILTGQCVEITQPTAPYGHMMELYSEKFLGYIKFDTETKKGMFFDSNTPVEVKGIQGCVAALELKPGVMFRRAPQDRKEGDDEWARVVEVTDKRQEPEVSLCALAAIIPTNVHSEEQYAETAYNALYMIDFCIDHNHYALPHMKLTAQARRNAGVGLMDIAHYMAQRKLSYISQEGMMELHRVAERHAYHLINASIRLGQERGNAEWIHKTNWPRGWTPQSTYNKNVDTLAPFVNQYDWHDVSQRLIQQGGGRFSSLIAHMPGESSSKYSACTNSLMDLRYISIIKTDGDNTMYWVAPEADTLKEWYSIAWKRTRKQHTDTYAIFQKWADQSISADDYATFEGDEKIDSSDLIEETNYMAQMGRKSLYYTNSETSDREALAAVMTRVRRDVAEDDGLDTSGPVCTSGGCSI